MTLNFKQSLLGATLALFAAALATAPATAAVQKKPAKAHTAAKKKAEPKKDEDDNGPSEADSADTITTDYRCEMGNVLTIFQHEGDDSHIALRWKKRIHRLEKVGTTTGAQRYQNTTFGLIWIGIPSKGMLLDSKLNRQLANECKNLDQEQGKLGIKTVTTSTEMPSTKVVEKVEPIEPPAPAGSTVPAATPAVSPAPVPATPVLPPATNPAAPAAPSASGEQKPVSN